MAQVTRRINLKQAPTGIKRSVHRTGLNVLHALKRGRAAQQWDLRTLGPVALPVLMDVAEHHRSQAIDRHQELTQGVLIDEIHAIEHRMTDGQRWMVQCHHQRLVIRSWVLESLLQPQQLIAAKATGRMATPMAVEQQ